MPVKFLHTADWQLGKPFAGVEDVQKRSALQQERIAVLGRIGETARAHGAEFIVVAGDLFDSPSATKSTVSAACSAIGAMGLPVYVIPGNHDHGGPGSLWEQPFYQREQASLAPNLHLLLAPEPVELDSAILLPCPLLRRHEATDTTAWLRAFESESVKPRVVLAHGSVQSFGSAADDEEGDGVLVNQIDLSRLEAARFDYIALGDWHGTKQVAAKAWYAGTPELDRFPRGEGYASGQVLIVEAAQGAEPIVTPVRTARFGWHEMAFELSEDSALAQLAGDFEALIGARAQQDLLRLELRGSLGIEATTRLEQLLESWQARLLRLKLSNQLVVAPSPAEIEALTRRTSDPFIARVATQLVARLTSEGEDAAIARLALRELHALCG
jgi:DNA repair exonuclease SbcCD nuclease subunit